MSMSLPLEAEQLIPHRLPMRLVDRLLAVDGKDGLVETRISAECPLLSAAGTLEDVALTELLAQAYAAVKGYRDLVDGNPVKQGFLVGIKKIVKLNSARVDDHLYVKIKTLAELDAFAVAEGEVWRGNELLGRGEIKVWIN